MFGTNYIIRSLLQSEYGQSFSVRTYCNTIQVLWYDGPTIHQVNKSLYRFHNEEIVYIHHIIEVDDNQ